MCIERKETSDSYWKSRKQCLPSLRPLSFPLSQGTEHVAWFYWLILTHTWTYFTLSYLNVSISLNFRPILRHHLVSCISQFACKSHLHSWLSTVTLHILRPLKFHFLPHPSAETSRSHRDPWYSVLVLFDLSSCARENL